ncbi:MAG: zinc-finger domain-containing protein [Arenicellales bacterium]
MSNSKQSEVNTAKAQKAHQVNTDDLPLYCPTADTELWNQHPRVYLPITPGDTALCPYCGTRFHLPDNTA